MPDLLFLAHATYTILDEYVRIHDEMWASPLRRNLRHLLPIPGFFAPINFATEAENLAVLRHALSVIRTEAEAAPKTAESDSATLLVALVAYVDALAETIQLLESIAQRLAAKAAHTHAFKWSDYRRALATYEESRMRCPTLGLPLNNALETLRNSA